MSRDPWLSKIVYVKKDFIYDYQKEMFTPYPFKKGEEHETLFSNGVSVAILGCMFSLDIEKDEHPSFHKHFYTLKEYRKEKLNKINNN